MSTDSSSAMTTYVAELSEIATSTGMLVWAGLGLLGFCSGLVSVVIARRRIGVVPNEPTVPQAAPHPTSVRETAPSTAVGGTASISDLLEAQPA